MVNLHLVSANITILISIVVFILSAYFTYGQLKNQNKTLKSVFGSFFTGVLLALGFTVLGITARTRLFQGITPGGNWDGYLLIFFGGVVAANAIIYHLTKE